jgi:flagellar L-ring protein precursor FlgH
MLLSSAGVASAQKKTPAQPEPPATGKESAYDVLFQRYLESARQMAHGEQASFKWMANLGSDFRARDVNDLVTIQVIESITATGSAGTNLGKTASGTASLGKFFGLETKLPASIDPTSLASPSSSTDFKGSGSTSRSGALTAVMTARVLEVLPNGDLVLEGSREIDINGDRQVIVLTGVVRRTDLAPDNSVTSTRVGQLRIRYFGNGLIKDNVKPGWLIRLLNKIF